LRYQHEEQGDDIEGDFLLVVTTLNEEDAAEGLPQVLQFSCLGCALETMQELFNKLRYEDTLDIQLVAIKTNATVKGESENEVH
jgi:hypothetical protein